MSKTYFIGSVVLVAAVIGAVLWYGASARQKKLGTIDRTMPKETVIELRDTGFDPPTATITKGMAVKWINNASGAYASVNSDTYPTNKLFPELNLGKFMKGQTLIHTFKTPGTYTYHDQFHPEHKGTIVVR
jgi:plastocyanin